MNLEIFKNNGYEVRGGVDSNNAPYFVLTDLCKALEIKNVSDCKARLKKDGVGSTEVIDSLGRKQNVTIVNESNMYKIIFQSRKSEALEFQDWVTSEVLPTIRKTGGYIPNDILNDSDKMVEMIVKLHAEKKEAERTKAEIGNRREATAMATASVATRKAKKLEILLDESLEWATVKRVLISTGIEYKWQDLKKISKALDMTIKKVPDSNFKAVNSYHSSVWLEVGVDISKLNEKAA